eukprot:g27638.t1
MGPFAKAPDRHGERAIQYVHPDATSRRHIVTPRPAMSGSDATASLADGDVRREASATVRASLAQVIEVSFARCNRVVMCLALLLAVGLMVVVVWAELVYSAHEEDYCDEPLAEMLRLIFLIIIIQSLQKTIMRHCLCYDMAQELGGGLIK